MPNALAFNLRIQAERRGAGGSKPQIDGIAVLIAGEAEPKVDRMLSPGALDGCSPLRIAPEMVSGPAQRVDCRPPSRANEATMRPCAVSASKRSARYRLDLPLPFGPMTTLIP